MTEDYEKRIAKLESAMRDVMATTAGLAEAGLELSVIAKNSNNAEERARGERAFQCIGSILDHLEAIEKSFPPQERSGD